MAKRKTHEEYINELEEIHNGTIKMLNRYTTKRNKGSYKCLTCDWTWESQAGNLIKNNNPSRCPNCAKLKLKQRMKDMNDNKFLSTKENVHIKIEEIFGDKYEILSEYEHHRKKLKLKCKYHGLFEQRYDLLIDGHGCPKCGFELRKAKRIKLNESSLKERQNAFYEKFKEASDDEYELVSNYLSVNRCVKIKHIHCGYIWDITPANFIWNQRRCPKCNLSKAMTQIESSVKNKELKYELEKRFLKCKNIRPLPFDIFIFNKLIIEYDGEHHFKPIDFSGHGIDDAINRFFETQYNDKIKNQYCIDNNIPLIRIPYWEFNNIEYILENVLKYFRLIDSDNTHDRDIVLKYLVDKDWDHDEYIRMAKIK